MSYESSAETAPKCLDVQSPDGTSLAVWVDGEGPALVLVHGSPSEHSTFDPLVQELRSDLTTFAMDRRGAGASGDTAPYAIEREFEDVAAVVDAVAAKTGARSGCAGTATDAIQRWGARLSPAMSTSSSFTSPASV